MTPDLGRSAPVRSTASVLAILGALGSFYLAAKGQGFFALLTAGAGILFGLIGFLRAASPRISGGILSLAAVALCAIAAVVALVVIVF